MKKIEAIIRPLKLEEIKAALVDLHIEGMTVSEVKGVGWPNGHTEIVHGHEYTVDFLPKLKVEIVLSDGRVNEAVAAIVNVARTGSMGGGQLFVSSLEDAVRIRTEETGEQAV